MAQGKLKLRSGRKTAPKKGKKRSSSKPVRRRKATKPLKGRTIVPKKAAKRKAAKQRKVPRPVQFLSHSTTVFFEPEFAEESH